MNILDREAFTIILGLIVLGSVGGAILYVNPYRSKPYTAIALLNENCRIGDYPRIVFNNSNIKLCLFIDNHLGYPALFRIDYRIAYPETPPNRSNPSTGILIDYLYLFVDKGENKTIKYNTYIRVNRSNIDHIYLIFTLWYLDPDTGEWRYTGRMVDLYVKIISNPLG